MIIIYPKEHSQNTQKCTTNTGLSSTIHLPGQHSNSATSTPDCVRSNNGDQTLPQGWKLGRGEEVEKGNVSPNATKSTTDVRLVFRFRTHRISNDNVCCSGPPSRERLRPNSHVAKTFISVLKGSRLWGWGEVGCPKKRPFT